MRDITEKTDGRKTAAALGFFDGLHIGHRAVIGRVTAKCGEDGGLSPAVFTFSGGEKLPKLGVGQKLLLSDEEKRLLLAEMGISYICAPPFASVRELSPEDFVRDIIKNKLCAAYVVCGYDFRFGKNGAGSAETLRELCRVSGIECEIVPAVEHCGRAVSSADIRSHIEAGEIEEANALLGREFGYTLPVTEGARLGRTIGFPTANQIIPDGLICPAHGVYASIAAVGGREYPAMTDIGVKPTVKSDDSVITETHIIGFSGDLYGEKLTVRLRRFLRPEKKFADLNELREQLIKDRKLCEA